MNPFAIIALLGVGLYLFTTASKASTFRQLNFIIKSLGVGWSGLSPIINVTILIQNPGNLSFTINNIVGNFYFNGQYLGTASSFQQKVISASSQTDYNVEVRLSVSQLVQDVIEIIQTKRVNATIRVEGNVNVDGLTVPIDVSYKIA